MLHVVCEGGGELAGALCRDGLVDEFVFIQAPLLLGHAARRAIAAPAAWDLAQAPRLIVIENSRLGPDLLVRARVQGKER
ncbi:Riboflavin biosynthesis protein RibD [compost metagenome]